MHFGRRYPSPGLRCLMAEKMLRELRITKVLGWRHFGIEKAWELVAKKCYKDLQLLLISVHQSRLGQNCLCLLIERTRVTTWAGLPMSWEGYELWYNPRHQVQIPIDAPRLPNLIDLDTIWPSSLGLPGITFELDYSYQLRLFCKDINLHSD